MMLTHDAVRRGIKSLEIADSVTRAARYVFAAYPVVPKDPQTRTPSDAR